MMNGRLEEREARPRVTFKDGVDENAEVGTNEMDALDTLDSMIDLSMIVGSEIKPVSLEQCQTGGYIGPGLDSDRTEEIAAISGSGPHSGGTIYTNPDPEIADSGVRHLGVVSAPNDHDRIQYEGSVSIHADRLSNNNKVLAHSKPRQFSPTRRSRDQSTVRLINGVSHHSGEESWQITWKTGVPLIIAYMAGVVFFIAFFHLDDKLSRLPYPLIGNLLDWNKTVIPSVWWENGAVLVLLLWCIAYMRRFLLIVLSLAMVRPYRPLGEKSQGPRMVTLGSCVAMVIYHIVMGAWLGWACNIYLGYMISDLQYVGTGLVLLTAAEMTSVIMTIVTLRRRKQRSLRYKITKNILDFISWLGFALVSLTLPAFVHLLVRIIIVFILLKSDTRPSCC